MRRGCRSREGLPLLEEAFLSETLYGLAVIWLILPAYYPILLRLLKRAFTFQSSTLQLFFAALSAIATLQLWIPVHRTYVWTYS